MERLMDTNLGLYKSSTHFKIRALQLSLTRTLDKIQDLVNEFEQLKLHSVNFEKEYYTQREKCKSQKCHSSIKLKKVIQTKDNLIQSVASAVTRLYETKDFNVIHEILNAICGETTLALPSDHCKSENTQEDTIVPKSELEGDYPNTSKPDKTLVHDESVSEIEGTPTGRRSPIISSKNLRTCTNVVARDKKKCPEDWTTPEKKCVKLMQTPTRSNTKARLKQSRLHLVREKSTVVVDLTRSSEVKEENMLDDVTKAVVKEDDDETILPSPSCALDFQSLHKSLINSPNKFKRPLSMNKLKLEDVQRSGQDEDRTVAGGGQGWSGAGGQHDRLQPSMKMEVTDENKDGDQSISLLACALAGGTERGARPRAQPSPCKLPLAENHNVLNVEEQRDPQTSLSLLGAGPSRRDPAAGEETPRVRVKVLPVYKEPAARTRAEKRALPGWSCDRCRNFYEVLYKDDADMLAAKMAECSKHRGVNDPARPRTPPGFWQPRWHVPEDTDEFNRRNDAL